MDKTRTVALVNHAAELGGAELALHRLVASLERRNWSPVVVFGENGPAVEMLRSLSVETYVLPMDSSVRNSRRGSLGWGGCVNPKRLLGTAGYIAQLRRFFRRRAVDLVHTNSMKAHVLGGLAGRSAGLPVVWHLRDSIHPSHLPHAAVRAMRLMAKRIPSSVVTVSQSVADDLLGKSPVKPARVIYDGLDDDCFEEPPRAKASPRGWRVGIAGRLSPWKGQHIFLDAAAKLLARGHTVDFEIVGAPLFGEAEYAEGLRQQVSALGIGASVTFTGFVSPIRERLQSWDIVVHASTASDPCPNVVLEAMAAGVPVVGSAGGGVPEILGEGEFGVLVPMGDSQALAAALERLLVDSAQRMQMARRARERARTVFRSERVAVEVQEVWEETLDGLTLPARLDAWVEQGFAAHRAGRRQPVLQAHGSSSNSQRRRPESGAESGSGKSRPQPRVPASSRP